MFEVSGLVFFFKLSGIGWKVRLKKTAGKFGTGTMNSGNEGMYTKSKTSKIFGPNLADKCAFWPKLKIWLWGIIFPYHAFVLPEFRDWCKSKALFS